MKQFIVIIEGPMGSGKTTIGKIVNAQLKRTAMVSTAHVKSFVSDFESNPKDNAAAAAVLLAMCQEYVKHGISILLPQAFWNKSFVEPFVALAEENHVPFLMYQLEAPIVTLRERIASRPKVVEEERINQNLTKWQENRYELGKVLDTSKLSAEEAAAVILKDIQDLQVA